MRVLLVDDEVALARALAQELGALHQIVLALGAEQALERLAEARYDVVLCDLKMPGMTGDQLYEEVARTNPAQAKRFVFMTGVGFGADVERFLALSGRPLLEKPFALIDALKVMGRVYARNGGAA
jgi:CheY-like chemotaxis protein